MRQSLMEFCKVNNLPLLEQWHPVLNGDLEPSDITSGSQRRVWWICDQGHEWQTRVSTRTGQNSGCPVCAGKVVVAGVNDLASADPKLAQEWADDTISPTEVTPSSNRKVMWRCSLGHLWKAPVADRYARRRGCPYCAGVKVLTGFNDLESQYPEVAEQWYQPLNGDLTPDAVTAHSHRKAWWICHDGHVWQARIQSRTSDMQTGCPVCAGNAPQRKGSYSEWTGGKPSARRIAAERKDPLRYSR